ncbi:hypothetical protein Micbo1qcDRAFT_156171, partial [Microdochium bolleyi]
MQACVQWPGQLYEHRRAARIVCMGSCGCSVVSACGSCCEPFGLYVEPEPRSRSRSRLQHRAMRSRSFALNGCLGRGGGRGVERGCGPWLAVDVPPR